MTRHGARRARTPKKATTRERLKRMLVDLNDNVELVCVFGLSYLNVMCALAFVVIYLWMTFAIFVDANWNNKDFTCY